MLYRRDGLSMLVQMNNRIHGGGVEKAFNFGGFGSVTVVAFGTMGSSSAVGERGVIGIDVEGCHGGVIMHRPGPGI